MQQLSENYSESDNGDWLSILSSEDEYLFTNGENKSDDFSVIILAIAGPHCNDDGNFSVLNESLLYLSSKKNLRIWTKGTYTQRNLKRKSVVMCIFKLRNEAVDKRWDSWECCTSRY